MKQHRNTATTRNMIVCGRLPNILLLALLSAQLASGQGAAPLPTQLPTVEQQARSALITAAQPASIVLDGSFTSIEGSLRQNGSAHLTTGSDGSFVVSLFRGNGPTGEARTISDGMPTCTWTDQAQVVHKTSFLNCIPPAWFFPGLTLLAGNPDPSVAAWTAASSANDSQGDHLFFQFTFPDSSPQDPLLLKPFELVLSPDTHLPRYATFRIRPDNGMNADTSIRIAYSDYRRVSGVMIPFHIQRFVNDGLVLDLNITTASAQ